MNILLTTINPQSRLTEEDIEHLEKKEFSFLTSSLDKVVLLLDFVQFKLFTNEDNSSYRVEDIAEGNLGDIESEIFSTLNEVLERMEAYFIDAFGINNDNN